MDGQRSIGDDQPSKLSCRTEALSLKLHVCLQSISSCDEHVRRGARHACTGRARRASWASGRDHALVWRLGLAWPDALMFIHVRACFVRAHTRTHALPLPALALAAACFARDRALRRCWDTNSTTHDHEARGTRLQIARDISHDVIRQCIKLSAQRAGAPPAQPRAPRATCATHTAPPPLWWGALLLLLRRGSCSTATVPLLPSPPIVTSGVAVLRADCLFLFPCCCFNPATATSAAFAFSPLSWLSFFLSLAARFSFVLQLSTRLSLFTVSARSLVCSYTFRVLAMPLLCGRPLSILFLSRPLHDSVTQSNSAFQSCESSRLDSQKL
jgi:hypothetical protein